MPAPESEERTALRLRLYHETANDTEAAEILGVRTASIRKWRRKMGLPAKRQRSVTKKEETKRMAAYAATESYTAAARHLGMNRRTLSDWLRRHGLPNKYENG